MRDPRGEADRWLRQARFDLEAALANRSLGYHALACYLSQQAAEKAVKALLYGWGERRVLGHSVVELLAQAAETAPTLLELSRDASRLDKLYIPTRYPNGLPGGVPAESYAAEDAADAIAAAERVVAESARLLQPEPGEES